MIDQPRIRNAVRELLAAIGEDPDREGLRDTPDRVARMYQELFGGLHEDVKEHFQAVFHQQYDEIVLVRDVPFRSVCEHHLLPFLGRAHVAYIPDGRILGLSKVARVIDHFARRPQVQERLTREIADAIQGYLQPLGVAVVLIAEHTCMTIRGVQKTGAEMVTSALEGAFRSDPAARQELMALMQHGLSPTS